MQAAFLKYILQLADTNLILAQRLCEWCGHGPILEQDIAMSNIGLDLLGQSRSLYQLAATVEGNGKQEDDYAYLRQERDFKNLLLVEQPNGDFAVTVVKQFLYDAYQLLLLKELKLNRNSQLAAIAEKSLIEATYHFKWSAEWVIRLGDGTSESHEKVQKALNDLWMYAGEMFIPNQDEQLLIANQYIPNLPELKELWVQKITEVVEEATLELPDLSTYMQTGGKNGIHTEHLGYILAEMQYIHRQYPGQQW
jgi:ring-1,2-phenylacetyl-CoA epoxidase subunit PaaC